MERLPDSVREALERNDIEAHKRMSAKGGINAGLLNADRKSQKEEDFNAFLQNQAELYQVNDEGDVLPPETKNETIH